MIACEYEVSFSSLSVSADFEADLQEVWSVRKNIHHAGGSKTVSTSNSSALLSSNPAQANAGQYSRHGAIPAQPTRGPQMQPATNKDHFNRGMYLAKCICAAEPYLEVKGFFCNINKVCT